MKPLILAMLFAAIAPHSTAQESARLKNFRAMTDKMVFYSGNLAERAVHGTALDCRLVTGADRDIPYDLVLRGAMLILNRYDELAIPAKLVIAPRNGTRTYGYIYLFDQNTGKVNNRILGIVFDGPGRVVEQRMLDRRSFPELCGGNIIPLE